MEFNNEWSIKKINKKTGLIIDENGDDYFGNNILQDKDKSNKSARFYYFKDKFLKNAQIFLEKPTHNVGYYISQWRHGSQHYDDPLTRKIIQNKRTDNSVVSWSLAKLMEKQIFEKNLGTFDCIIPVPNFNPNDVCGGVSIGIELAKILEIECYPNALKKRWRLKGRWVSPHDWDNMHLYWLENDTQFTGMNVLLVDDIQTRGCTRKQCISQIARSKPKNIEFMVVGITS